MTRSLQMGRTADRENFLLPPEAVTSTFGVLAMRGSGKSNTGAVFAEEFWDLSLQCVVIDPKGDYHGLRSSKDGTGPGLAIPVFGGLHGDLPLAHTAGAVMAELIKSTGMSCILDVSDFDSKAQQVRFLTDFGTALYRAGADHVSTTPTTRTEWRAVFSSPHGQPDSYSAGYDDITKVPTTAPRSDESHAYRSAIQAREVTEWETAYIEPVTEAQKAAAQALSPHAAARAASIPPPPVGTDR